MDIQELRKYRIDLNFNEKTNGIALFDLSLAFIGAIVLDIILNLSGRLTFCKNRRLVYYLLVIPFGVVVHHIVAHIQSFLNKKSLLFPDEITFLNKKLFTLNFNIYQFLFVGLLLFTYNSCKI